MEENVEKLIVALMVLLDEMGGERHIDADVYERMFDARHRKGIQVKELGDGGITLILGDMPISPEEAQLN